jgi:hypothetical protein
MKTFDQIGRIKRLHYLIRTRSTGTPGELASKLAMSESQCYWLLKQLKENYQAPIYYSKAERSYCYEKDVEFTFGFVPV